MATLQLTANFADQDYLPGWLDGNERLTRRRANELYAVAIETFVEEQGGRFLFAGDVSSPVIGEVEEMWDRCALVEYPSAAAFAMIATSLEVGEIGVHLATGPQDRPPVLGCRVTAGR